MFFLLAKTVESSSPPAPYPHKSQVRLGYQTGEEPSVSRDQFLSELNEVAGENRRVEKQVLKQVGL